MIGRMDTELLADGQVRVDDDGHVLTVTLARPEARNAQTPATWAALAEVGRSLPAHTRAVVLRGEGPTFSAGLDRRMFTAAGVDGEASFVELVAAGDAEIVERVGVYQEAFTWWRSCDAITVAAVHGHAVGAGFQLALACDLLVADDTALFCMKEPALGLVPDLAGTAPLVAAVGYPRALEICASSREVGADEALRIGLAVRVVPAGGLDAAVAEVLAPMLAAPAGAITATKHLLRGAQHRHPVEQRLEERLAQVARLRELAALLAPPQA